MAELKPVEVARLFEKFLPAYNALYGTDFVFDEKATKANEKAPGSNRDPSIDYVCTSGSGERLLLQHTEAWSDAKTERLWPRRVKWVRVNLQAEVARMPGAPYIVGLGVQMAPDSPEEARAIVGILADEIREHIPLLDAGGPVEWRPSKHVRKFVGEVSLERPGEPNLQGFSPGYANAMQRMIRESLARSPMQPADSQVIASDYIAQLDPVGERAVIALEKKNALYVGSGRNLVLLIHYRVTGYDEEDLPVIARDLESVPADFKAVWVVSDWSMEGGHAHRIVASAAQAR